MAIHRVLNDIWEAINVGTGRNELWQDCPELQIILNPLAGHRFFTDFIGTETGVTTEEHDGWTLTQATTGTWALDDAAGGVMLCDCNSATATQGANVQLGLTTGECFIPAAGKDIWYEARIKIADTATGPELFVGLAVIDTTVIGSSAVSTANHIGFTSVTDDNVVLLNGEKAGAGDTNTFTTLVDDTWARIGFHVDGVTSVQGYLNGVPTGSPLATANVPIVELVPTFVCQSGGTTDPILHIDWVKCIQLR